MKERGKKRRNRNCHVRFVAPLNNTCCVCAFTNRIYRLEKRRMNVLPCLFSPSPSVCAIVQPTRSFFFLAQYYKSMSEQKKRKGVFSLQRLFFSCYSFSLSFYFLFFLSDQRSAHPPGSCREFLRCFTSVPYKTCTYSYSTVFYDLCFYSAPLYVHIYIYYLTRNSCIVLLSVWFLCFGISSFFVNESFSSFFLVFPTSSGSLFSRVFLLLVFRLLLFAKVNTAKKKVGC